MGGEDEGTDLRTKIPRQSTQHICFHQASLRLLGMTVLVPVLVKAPFPGGWFAS
jgi:hypothetical protein